MTRVWLYDTTLRDGTQGEGFQLSVAEKVRVAHLLDDLGVAYIEGGWPGSNPRDEAFFEAMRGERLQQARVTAFGSTRRAGIACADDPSLAKLLEADVPVVTVFGKSWRFQATTVLGISPEENVELVHDTVRFLAARVDTVIFDAEHYFDGAADDEAYALAVLAAAADAGARFLTLCDTNGGTLPHVVGDRVARALAHTGTPVGIHAHNDAELAVANSLEAVRRGATLVQGTINGYGERCGNANLVSILPALQLKAGHDVVAPEALQRLSHVSRMVDELSNNAPFTRQPWVGQAAFAHKGGVHVHAVMKDPRAYEHVDPGAVGNARRVLVSDLSGGSNVAWKAAELGYDLDPKAPATRALLARIKALEHAGYSFEDAEASLGLLFAEAHGTRRTWFEVEEADVWTVVAEPAVGDTVGHHRTRAVVRIRIGDHAHPVVAYGNGPVDALGQAFRDVVCQVYPALRSVRLVDYKVRIMDSSDGISAQVRVLIKATDGVSTWGTVGVSTNVVEASWRALVDLYEHQLAQTAGAPDAAAVHPGRASA
ncbi:MAG: citramalate synthase [Alphaproteobacteria bacterium]|nr:citramalate synthase [Alphaproteobacteria bacterium]